MTPKLIGSFMLASGAFMILTFVLVGLSTTTSPPWLAVSGCVSGLVLCASGYVIRRLDRWS